MFALVMRGYRAVTDPVRWFEALGVRYFPGRQLGSPRTANAHQRASNRVLCSLLGHERMEHHAAAVRARRNWHSPEPPRTRMPPGLREGGQTSILLVQVRAFVLQGSLDTFIVEKG